MNMTNFMAEKTFQVPFTFEMTGRVWVKAPENISKKALLEKAEEVLEKMKLSEMLEISNYLPYTEQIDKEGVILEFSGKEAIFNG